MSGTFAVQAVDRPCVTLQRSLGTVLTGVDGDIETGFRGAGFMTVAPAVYQMKPVSRAGRVDERLRNVLT